MTRKVDSLGRVVLPVEMRRRFGIAEGDLVEIAVQGRQILLSKVESRCVFCGSDTDLSRFAGRQVCGRCVESLNRAAHEPGA